MNAILAERTLSTGQTLQIVQGDITAETTDAIVNAANAHLQHGAGVAGAILRQGGSSIQRDSDAWVREHGLVPHAHPAWTSGGLLRAKYVIHAVGPVWPERSGGAEADAKLRSAVQGSLALADQLHCSSISLPALSTGVFGFPKERAARVILPTIETYFADRQSEINLVRVVLFDQGTVDAFMGEMGNWKS